MKQRKEVKISFSVSMYPSTVAAVDKLRGNMARSVFLEALIMDCLGFPDDMTIRAKK